MGRVLLTTISLILLAVVSVGAQPAGQWFDGVFIIVMENTDPLLVLGNSYFSSLANGGTLLTDVNPVGRPSQPNYIGMVAGSPLTVTSNANFDLPDTCIVDKLEAAGISWKAYMEDFPSACFTGNVSGKYARRHNPFISFDNIRNNASMCAKIVNADELATDLTGASPMPMYAFYTPNNDHNGHDTNVTYSASWLDGFLTPLLTHTKFQNTLIVVTWDEGTPSNVVNKVITILRGKGALVGANDTRTSSHYGLLRTIEDNWSLGDQGRFDATASSFLPVVTSAPTTTSAATSTAAPTTTASTSTAPPTTTTASTSPPTTTQTTSSSPTTQAPTTTSKATTAPPSTTPSVTQSSGGVIAFSLSVMIFGSLLINLY